MKIQNDKYTSSIRKYGLMVYEMQAGAKAYLQNMKMKDVLEESLNNNIFLCKTLKMKQVVAYRIINRLQVLDDLLIQELTKNNFQTNCNICLYSLLKTDRLFFEFCNEVLKDFIETKRNEFKRKDILCFLQIKSQQSEVVNSWTEDIKIHLISSLVRPLIKAGILMKRNDTYIILPPIIDSVIQQHIESLGDKKYLEILGV